MTNDFKPFISKTSNIPEFIKKVSKKFKVQPSRIDFDILNVSTGVKLPNGDKYVPLSPKVIEKINNDEAFLRSSKIDIKQSYEVNIRPKLAQQPIKLSLEVGVDKYHTKATGVLKKESTFEHTTDIEDILIDEINKRKIKLGMLVNVKDDDLRATIKECAQEIKNHGNILDDIKLPLANWVAPTPTNNDKMIFHYNKKTISEDEKIDYADRGFVQEVNEGDLVVEYKKSSLGVAGRGFNGKHIPITRPRDIFKDSLKPDKETIRIEKTDSGFLYYAKKEGFVSVKNKILKIGEDMAVTSINFKETGNIVTDLDKNITITTNGGEGEDDIGTNMKVETSNINIGGNIGSKAEVKAINVVVHGSTHGTSKITCTDANVNNLRGFLQCQTADINQFEGGDLYCKKAVIKKAKGGKIHCEELEIDELDSNVTIFAKNRVYIKNMDSGGENTIVMDAGATKQDRIKIRLVVNEVNELKARKKVYLGKYQALNNVIKRNKPGVDEIKKRLDKEKAKGISSEKIFVDKYKAYQDDLKKAKKLREEIQKVDEKHKIKVAQVNELQSVVLASSVINEDTWKGYNKIMFKTMMPPKEYVYLPEEEDYAREIRIRQKSLEDVEEGFEIYVVGQDEES
ncbi:MAG: FapA family protein [Campylobacterales bacterium]|nr:FapA family protein [Campylobacterales bacterium]